MAHAHSPDTQTRHAGERPTTAAEAAPLAAQPLCAQVLQQRYLQAGERHADDLLARVAQALAQHEAPEQRSAWAARLLHALQHGGLLAGRILVGAGTGLHTTLASGFVQPVGDSVRGHDEAGRPGIYKALGEAAETLRRGGDVGCDFSALRPRGALVRSTAALASGPCSYIALFGQSGATLAQGSAHRSVHTALLHIDHPDILDFLDTLRHAPWPQVQPVVGVTDAFMQALAHDEAWPLVHPAAPGPTLIDQGAHWRGDGLWVYRALPARTLWQSLLQAMPTQGAPSLLFLDTVQRDNPLRSLESLQAASACGAMPLPAYGSAVLGALVLPRFVRQPFGPQAHIDFEALAECTDVLVRALDNALELSDWPLPAQQREAHTKRRIGLGLSGLADALAMLGLRYDSEEGRAMAVQMARSLRDSAFASSVALAREKGPCPLFNAEAMLAAGTFASRLPDALQHDIRRHGLRNGQLLCTVPLGGVELALADNTSSGIAPARAWREAPPPLPQLHVQAGALENHAFRRHTAQGGDPQQLPEAMRTTDQIAPQDQLAMAVAVQAFIDGGLSTVLAWPASAPLDALDVLCTQAWQQGLKSLSLRGAHSAC